MYQYNWVISSKMLITNSNELEENTSKYDLSNIRHKISCLLVLIFMGLMNALKMGPFLHKNYQINKKKSDMTTVFSYIHSFTLFLESILYSLYSTNVYMKILKLIYAHLKTTGYPFY